MAEGARKLSEEELFQCLKSLNVPVRMNDLKVPTKEFLIRVFECCLKDLQIDIISPNLRPWHAVKHFEEVIYEDAIMKMLLVSSINLITSQDDLYITAKDMLEPKPKRTKKILNYLIVFWNHYLKMFALYQDLDECFQQQKQMAEVLKKEQESLDEKHKECLEMLQTAQPSKEELSSLVASKDQKIDEFNKQRDSVEVEYQAVKKLENDLKAQVSSADIHIISVKEKINEIDQLILTSPEKLTTELQKIKEMIRNEEMKIKEKETKLAQKKVDLNFLQLSQEDNQKAVDIIHEVQTKLIDLSNNVNSLGSGYAKLKEEEATLKKLKDNLNLKEKSKHIYEQKSVKVQITTKKQKETLIESLKNLQRDDAEEQKCLEIAAIEYLELERKVDKKADDVLEIVGRFDQAEAETEKKEAEYNDVMDTMAKAFENDCVEIKTYIKKSFEF